MIERAKDGDILDRSLYTTIFVIPRLRRSFLNFRFNNNESLEMEGLHFFATINRALITVFTAAHFISSGSRSCAPFPWLDNNRVLLAHPGDASRAASVIASNVHFTGRQDFQHASRGMHIQFISADGYGRFIPM
jgi:hypothetical protein